VKPLPAVREYQYWSERLVATFWQDNVAQLPDKTNMSIGLSVGLASIGFQAERQDPPGTRAARAAATEDLLTDLTVRDLDYTGPIGYLAGRSQLVLSSLQNPNGTDTGAVTLFADLQSPEGRRVAVCLFGSAQNVCSRDSELPSWRRFGWTSSTNDGVKLLLQASASAEESETPGTYWREAAGSLDADPREICWNAANICSGQGSESLRARGPSSLGRRASPWHRGYTIGHYWDVEWLAQIYFSNDGSPDSEGSRSWSPGPFDVIHVGAAFWVRSASPRAWVPYTEKNVPRLEAEQHPPMLRQPARIWYSFQERHLRRMREAIRHPRRYGVP
jgi:hypothetical protein